MALVTKGNKVGLEVIADQQASKAIPRFRKRVDSSKAELTRMKTTADTFDDDLRTIRD